MRVDYLLAWILPLLAGTGLWSLLAGTRRRGDWAAAVGTGLFLGLFLAAFGASRLARGDTVQAFATVAPWLGVAGALFWGIVLVRSLRVGRGTAVLPPEARLDRLARGLWWLLLALVLIHLLLVGEEASLRPVFPWDAWSAWAVKAKTWMLIGKADPYVPMSEWLAGSDASLRTLATWNYPEMLAWIEVWFASAAGGWNEPLVNLAWTGALAAFVLAAYGSWRGFGLSPPIAMMLAYALASLPLLDVHAALAGYADLWLAATLGLATLAWTRWLLHREHGQWLLGVGLALLLPAIKLEGAVWALLFSAVVVLERLPPRWGPRIAAVVAVAVIIGVLAGGLTLPMLGLGWVRVSWGSVEIPGVATYALTWHPVGREMLDSLFSLPNWHLLWYAFPLLLVVRWRILCEDRAVRLLGLLVLMQMIFLFGLFFFTGAAAWAKDFTSANRLILHVVPTVFVLAALLLRGVSINPVVPTGARESREPISRG